MNQQTLPRFSAEEVRHIAILCRIGLTDTEVELFREQLPQILDQFQVLLQVNTEGIPPTGRSGTTHSVMREDNVVPSFSVEDVLANAPHREGDHFRVRAILE